MQKRINIFLIIFSIFISSIMGIDKVSGTLWGNYEGAAPCPECNAGGSSNSNGRTQRIIATGYRVSVLNVNNGNLAPGTHSVDYWPTTDNSFNTSSFFKGGFDYLSGCVGGTKADKDLDRIARYYGQDIKHLTPKLPKTLVGKTTQEETIASLEYDNYNKKDFIVSNSLSIINEKLGTKLDSNSLFISPEGGYAGDTRYNNNYTKFALIAMESMLIGSGQDGVHTDSDYIYIGQLLKDCGYTGGYIGFKDIVLSATKEGYVIAVEPVMALSDTSANNNTNLVYVGTQAELNKLKWTSNFAWSFPRYSYLHPVVYAYSEKDPETVAGITTCTSFNTINDSNVKNASDNNHCLGIYLFNLPKFISAEGCSDIVTDYINTGVDSETFKNNIMSKQGMDTYTNSDWLKQYDSYGFNDLTALKNYLNISGNEECPPPNCNYIAQKNITTNMTLDSYNSVITILKKLTGYPSTIPTGEVLKAEAYKENFITSNSSLCGTISCNDLLESLKNNNKLNVDNLNKLNKLFGEKYDLLKIENLKMLYGENKTESELLKNASCAKTPYCPVDSINASCNGNNAFTFKDTTETEDSCLKKGIAYNKSSSGTPILLQTSYDYDFGDGTPGDETNPPGYCEESVTFDFPTNVTNTVKAGTVFKWGLDDIEGENDLFGTMKVTRKCYLSKDLLNKSKNEIITIKSDWANVSNTGDGRINPLIKLTYSQAVESNKVIYNNTPLTVKLSKFEMEQTGFTDYNQVTYDELGNELPNADRDRGGDPRTMTCGGGGQACNSNPIVMTATYNIVYGNEFKWYSDKSNGDSLVKEEDREAEHINSYVYLGYGLPTSFLSSSLVVSSSDPAKSNLCEPYGGPGNSASDKTENRGSMYVELSQIGTRNKDNNTYHFDNYVKANLVLDDDKDIGAHSDVFYSCTYQTRNSLFDNESGNGDLDNCTNTPPKGLDVVFRTVSLVDADASDIDSEIAVAFPGRVGNGRTLGSNWEKINAVGTNGKNQILQILSNDVYDQEPLYEIELDVPLIQEIREANRNARDDGKDPYTDMTAVPPLTYYVALDEGYLGYVYTDTGGVYSGFLGHLSRQGELESVCLSGVVTTSHEANCNQSWWLDTDKHTVTVE